MKMMLRPLSRSRRSTAEQPLDLGRRQRRGRLVEDDDARARKTARATSSTSCCTPIGKSPMARPRIDVEPEVVQLLGGSRGHPPPVHEAEPVDRLGAEKDVLGDAELAARR